MKVSNFGKGQMRKIMKACCPVPESRLYKVPHF